MNDWAKIAGQAESLIKEAGILALSERENLSFKLKSDKSVVTNADLAVERFLRKELLNLTPGASFWGEEMGFEEQSSEGLWVIDPIDGTSNFWSGQPLWGITCAFIKNSETKLGFIYLPELKKSLSGVIGCGAMVNGEPLKKIPSGDIEPHQLVGHGDSTASLQHMCPGKMRHVGAFCVEIAFVAMQYFRALTTGKVMLYDCAGGILICKELGAEVKEIDGSEWNLTDWMKPERCNPFFVGPSQSNFPYKTNS